MRQSKSANSTQTTRGKFKAMQRAAKGAKRLRMPARKPGWREKFLSMLRRVPSIALAAESAGVDRSLVYKVRERNPAFAAKMQSALEHALELAEGAVFVRGVQGVKRTVWMKVRKNGEDTPVRLDADSEYSDRCLLAWLAAHNKAKWGTTRSELTGADGAALAPAVISPTQVVISIPSNGRDTAPAIDAQQQAAPQALSAAGSPSAVTVPQQALQITVGGKSKPTEEQREAIKQALSSAAPKESTHE